MLPELAALRGVEQSVFHHLDVYDHTLEVLDAVAQLEPATPALGEHADAVRELLAEPLADELTRGGGDALRRAAARRRQAADARRAARRARDVHRPRRARARELARDVLRRLRASATAAPTTSRR